MAKQHNRQGGQDRRQPSQQDDRRPQQSRDLQRNKQSDSQGAQPPGGRQQSEQGGRQHNQQSDGKQPQDRQQKQQNVYGEGNYAASKQYNDATREFARSGRVERAAREAAPRDDADALQMQAAEAEGKRHAKGEDPALNRKSSTLNRKSSNLSPDATRAPKPGEEE